MISKPLIFYLSWLSTIFLDIASAQDLVLKNTQAFDSGKNTQVVLFEKGRLFIQAEETTLNDLLVAVAKQADIIITAYIPLDQSVTVDIQGYSIDEAFKSILRDYSYIYAKTSSPILWILPQDGKNEMATDRAPLKYPLEPVDTVTSVRLQALSDDPEEREDALADLGRIDRLNAITPLTSAITDPDHSVREAAIVTLALIGGSEAVDALSIALADQDPRIREEAIDALCEIGGETAVSVLQQALEDEVAFVRQAAMDALDELQK
jgi:hypothetical protein